jgi:negative regulator of flagellin synthesis FlgM
VGNRIQGLDSQSVETGANWPVESVRRATPAGDASGASSSSADQVHITDSAIRLANMTQALKDTPDIDGARVQAVQQQLANGQYQVNPGQIADRLLQLEGDLSAAG